MQRQKLRGQSVSNDCSELKSTPISNKLHAVDKLYDKIVSIINLRKFNTEGGHNTVIHVQEGLARRQGLRSVSIDQCAAVSHICTAAGKLME